jgi:predicted AlkP superfamily phosphohydrolase/phosphomutase
MAWGERAGEQRPGRLLIIGWDGADWEILDDLVARDVLPTVKAILESGLRGDLLSTIPSHSWAAWSSFLTGVNPGRHGIFDFVERHPTDPTRRIPVSSTSIGASTFLERLSEAGKEVRVGNIPVTYPPMSVRGKMISGVAIPRGANFVHPPEWEEELQQLAPFPINGMEPKLFRDRPEALVEEARRFVEQRSASFELLLEGDWDLAACVYVAPDRLQHAFGAYLLPSHPDYPRLSDTPLADAIRGVYALLDANIDRLRAAAGPDTTVILMSDHGFRPVSRATTLNGILRELGYWMPSRSRSTVARIRRSGFVRNLSHSRVGLRAKQSLRRPSSVNWDGSRAYGSATGGGVSVNLRGREPNGIVEAKDLDATLAELTEALLAYEDPRTGSRPVAEVQRREELYDGPYVDLAPDLFVITNDQWSFAEGKDWTGEHRREGILAATGGRVSASLALPARRIEDIPATALAFCGVPAGDIDGRPIEEIAGRALEPPGPRDLVAPRRARDTLSDEENEQIAQHLRELGYIE